MGRIAGFVLILWSCGVLSTEPERLRIEVGGVPALVEVAATPEARQRGLMHRYKLGPEEGMLFVFPREQPLRFWMKNTPLPLDIGFFDDDGFLIEHKRLKPEDETVVPSSEPARYALEMNQGWFARHNLRKFMRLKLPHPIAAR